MTQATEQVQKPEKPKPLSCIFELPAYTFYEILKAVNAVATYGHDYKDGPADITFKIDKKGISLRSFDSSRVAMVDFLLTKKQLDQFKVKSEGNLVVDGAMLLKLLKGVRRETTNSDGTIKTEGEILALHVEDPEVRLDISHSEYNRTWNLKALTPDYDDVLPVPKYKTNVTFKCTKKQLQRVIDDAVKATDHLRFIATMEGVKLEGKSEEGMVEYEGELSKDSLLELTLQKTDEPLKTMYNLGFLQNMLKNMPKDTEILTISYDQDMPVTIETGQYDRLTYYLAPRIEV